MALRKRASIAALVSLIVAVAACGGQNPSPAPTPTPIPSSIHKIKHVIVIMQENRSFDSYFGTYPGADGIPMRYGVPRVCVPDPSLRTCDAPYVDHADVNSGGPHDEGAA